MGIHEVGGTNIINCRFSSLGRILSTTSRFDWLRVGHILLWTRMEVSFHHIKLDSLGLIFPVGGIIRRERPSQQGENPPVTHTTLRGPLRQLYDLDRALPQFYEQLSGFLRGEKSQKFPGLKVLGLVVFAFTSVLQKTQSLSQSRVSFPRCARAALSCAPSDSDPRSNLDPVRNSHTRKSIRIFVDSLTPDCACHVQFESV
jgi:hypothetical protein